MASKILKKGLPSIYCGLLSMQSKHVLVKTWRSMVEMMSMMKSLSLNQRDAMSSRQCHCQWQQSLAGNILMS
jgi:hypothetical protein